MVPEEPTSAQSFRLSSVFLPSILSPFAGMLASLAVNFERKSKDEAVGISNPRDQNPLPSQDQVQNQPQVPIDDRSSMAKAMGRASEASTIGFSIAICFVIGYWCDRWLGTSPIFAVVGLGLGLATAFLQLLKLIKKLPDSDTGNRREVRFPDEEDSSEEDSDTMSENQDSV